MLKYYVVDMSDYVVASFNVVEKQTKFFQKNYQRGFKMCDSIHKVKNGKWLNPSLCQ